MMNMKNFTTYIPDVNPYAGLSVNVIFFRDAKKRDWYESQKLFAKDTLKVCYVDKNVIVQYSYDVSALTPDGYSVAEVKGFEVDSDINLIDGTWIFNGKNITKRIYTPKEIQHRAESQRQRLIASASETISLWQSELLLGVISDEDKARLMEWMAYIKKLNAMNFSRINDEVDYNEIEWPEVPGNVA